MPASDGGLVYGDFADKVGEVFTVSEDGLSDIGLVLQKAEPLNAAWSVTGVRPPFALTFLAENPTVLPQRLYRMGHAVLGKVTIFLVPSGKTAAGVTYHATFN